jgi:FtsP/CotA-like multicopper oxidase with cupredoxin domain
MHRRTFLTIAGAGVAGAGLPAAGQGAARGYQTTEVDFIADQPGLTLFHCHQQIHMDFGFMGLFETT